jgi:hypothetical protein
MLFSHSDSQGNLTGTAFGDKIEKGSFNANSGEIRFARRPKGAIDTYQGHTGYISTLKTGGYLLGGSYSQVVVGVVFFEVGMLPI